MSIDAMQQKGAPLSRRLTSAFRKTASGLPLVKDQSCSENSCAETSKNSRKNASSNSMATFFQKTRLSLTIRLRAMPWLLQVAYIGSPLLLTLYLLDSSMKAVPDSNWLRIMNNSSSTVVHKLTDLHIAFVGDSVTRYMYIAFVYLLRHGHFVEDFTYPNILNAYQFPTWNDHYNFSTRMLAPNEQCDCFRQNLESALQFNKEDAIENRYYSDPSKNNYISFIQIFGGYTPHGHWNPPDVLSKHVLNFGLQDPIAWRYDWPSLIREYLSKLEPKPRYLVFNEGLHIEHELGDKLVRQSIKDALDDSGIIGIYKTTTLPNVASALAKRSAGVVFNRHDPAMCKLFDNVLDFSWTKNLDSEHYWDGIHFKPHVNKAMVIELLDLLKKLEDGGEIKK